MAGIGERVLSGILLALTAGSTAGGFTVSANDVIGSGRGEEVAGLVTTAQLPNVMVQGGAGPFTYTWSFVSGDSSIICLNNAEADPTWQGVVSDATSAVWRLTVVAAAAVATIEITITLLWTQVSAGGIEL